MPKYHQIVISVSRNKPVEMIDCPLCRRGEPCVENLQLQLALLTAERDKAIERSAIFERAVDHYADIRNWYCPQCNVGGESPDCPLVSLRCSNNHQGFDIAVKAKQEAEEVR